MTFFSAGVTTSISLHLSSFLFFNYYIRPICHNFSISVYTSIPLQLLFHILAWMYVYHFISSSSIIEHSWLGSSVGIATDYGLEGLGSNPGGDKIFRPSRPALGPTQPPVKWVTSLSRG